MGKIASTLLTFLLSIPITAFGFMAIFGIPDIGALNASPSNDIVIRDPYEQNPWGQQSEAEQELGAPQRFPNSSVQSDYPQGKQQLGGQHSSASSEAPTWGQNNSPSMESRQQPNVPRNPFDNRMTGHSAPNQPLTTSEPFPGSNVENRFANNVQPETSNAFLTNTAAPRENPFAGNGMNNNRPNTTETSAQMLTWTQASARLTELGIKYHLERGDQEGSFLFVCLYNPVASPQVTHRFEAEENDPLVAVNKVIGQVEGWLQQQYRNTHSATASRY